MNKELYIERVINYLLEDTHFYLFNGWGGGYGGNLIAIDFPMYPEQTLFYEFDIIIGLYNGDKWDIGADDIKYITNTYGITDKDEIAELFQIYKFRLAEMILPLIDEALRQDNTLNESVRDRDDYLDRIIDFIIEDTSVDIQYDSEPRILLIYPMTPGEDNEYYFSVDNIKRWLNGDFVWRDSPEDVEYAKDYGITDRDEMITMYTRYMKKLCALILQRIQSERGQLNESMDRRGAYLEQIVKYLMDDTIINYNLSSIVYPFMESKFGAFTFTPATMFSSEAPFSFDNYVIDNYLITREEAEYVWRKYSNILMDKFRNGGSINESFNRMSREKYLDKISDFLVEDTIHHERSVIEPPYYYGIGGIVGFSGLYSGTFINKERPYNPVDSHIIYFRHYVMSTYDIAQEEVLVLWEMYINKMANRLGDF